MSGNTIDWNVADPANSGFVAQGAAKFRSLQVSVQSAIAAEHVFGNGVPSGAHALGSARVFVGTSSQVSSADTSGRLMFNSTNSTFVVLGSNYSQIVGGRAPIAPIGGGHIGWQTSGLTSYVGIDANVASNIAAQSTTVVSFNHVFTVPPILTLSVRELTPALGKPYAPEAVAIGTSSFTLFWEGVSGGSASTCSVSWIAVGRVANP